MCWWFGGMLRIVDFGIICWLRFVFELICFLTILSIFIYQTINYLIDLLTHSLIVSIYQSLLSSTISLQS